MLISRITVILAILAAVVGVRAQSDKFRPPDELLAAAEARSREYVEKFRDLLATEARTFVKYKKSGEQKVSRTVKSLFLVTPLTKDPERVIEFRNVTAVDGKPVEDGDKRAGELFSKLANAETSEKEIKRLQDEALRYDDDVLISGLTLFQSVALRASVRPAFTFTVRGKEMIGSTPVIVVEYSQQTATPLITTVVSGSNGQSGKDAAFEIDADKDIPLNGRLTGKLYLDEATLRLRKEIRTLNVQPDRFPAPVTVIEEVFEYQDSSFGILTPRHITHTQYRLKVKERRLVKDVTVEFEYSDFSRPDVEVKADDVKPKS